MNRDLTAAASRRSPRRLRRGIPKLCGIRHLAREPLPMGGTCHVVIGAEVSYRITRRMWQTGIMPYWFDGNSLVGKSSAALRTDRKTLRAFLNHLGDHVKMRGGRYIVFFDGEDPSGAMPPRGVRVRFSAPRSADDAILDGLEHARTPGEIIVVSNDRSLLSRCRAAGSRIMSWQEFNRCAPIPTDAARELGSKEETVEVEEWARYFGLDRDSLK